MSMHLMPGEWDWMKDIIGGDELDPKPKPPLPEDEDNEPKPAPEPKPNVAPLYLLGAGVVAFLVIDTLLSRRK